MKLVTVVVPVTKVLLLLPQEVEIFNIAKRLERDFPHIEINICEREIASAISQIKEIQPHYVIYAIHHFTGDKSILEYELRMGDFTIINVVSEKDFKAISDEHRKEHFLKEPVDIDELIELLQSIMLPDIQLKALLQIINSANEPAMGNDPKDSIKMISNPECLWMRKLDFIYGNAYKKNVHCVFLDNILGDSSLGINNLFATLNPNNSMMIGRSFLMNIDKIIEYDRVNGAWLLFVCDTEVREVKKEYRQDFLYFMGKNWCHR